MKQHRSTRTRLRPGQTMHFHAERGLTVVAAAGAIHLAMIPALPDEQAMRQAIPLREGEAHVVQESGWLAVSAQQPAEMVCIIKEAWLLSLWRHCLCVAATYRRRLLSQLV